MFERFTDRARRALVVAQQEARDLSHELIAPGHLLLALTEEGAGIAARAMSEVGVDAARLRERVASSSKSTRTSHGTDQLPFSAQAKKALELSLREALKLGDQHIGTEHLLLGVIRFDEGVEALLGVDPARLRAAVLRLKSGAAARRSLSPAVTAAMDRARRAAGTAPMTSGQLLSAMVEDDDSQAAAALRSLGLTSDAVREALAGVPVEGTSDEEPDVPPIELKLGDTSIEVTDKALIARLLAASPREVLGALTAYFHGRAERGEWTASPEESGHFTRFTERARRALVLAQEEARLFNHGFVGTEHLLLGLMHEGGGIAAKALESFGVSLAAVRQKVEETIGKGTGDPVPLPPFTPRAKKVLELSLRESLHLGHNYVGTEHLLLGLMREEHGVAAQALADLGADLGQVRERVLELIADPNG